MQKTPKATEIVTWVAIVVLFVWCFRITAMIGSMAKRQDGITTQMLNVLVMVSKKVGIDLRVAEVP